MKHGANKHKRACAAQHATTQYATPKPADKLPLKGALRVRAGSCLRTRIRAGVLMLEVWRQATNGLHATTTCKH
eukprot:10147174-Alexandrium_andersonii.AAC.1